MLRPLRRRLALIRYYSASREETPWTRAGDAMLFITLVLALPAVLLCDASVIRPSVALEQKGTLDRASAGHMDARLAEPERNPPWTERTVGTFTLQLVEESRGWPLSTSIQTLPLRIEYDLLLEPKSRPDTGGIDDEPKRDAIEAALVREDRQRLLLAMERNTPERKSEPLLRWALGAGLWWVFLYIAGMCLLGLARLGAAVWQRQVDSRARRFARLGRCIHCGYDLRGTEFSERCPECGELAD